MLRRGFLRNAALFSAAAAAAPIEFAGASAAQTGQPTTAKAGAGTRPIRIVLGGYAPASTGFSLAIKKIGDRLAAKFGDQIEVHYVYNILDLGYRADDILWLVESGVLTLGNQSSSYFTDRIPDLGVADLPFIFPDADVARAAMDGAFGRALTTRIEAAMDLRVAGYFENGFRHVSNRVRAIHAPADLKDLSIRVLPSKVQARTFELLGAKPKIMDLTEAIEAVKAGTLDAQENPFANTVTYGIHKYHRFHTATNHFYLSRPIFLHRPSFDGWPRPLQEELGAAVRDAVTFQRDSHVKEEEDAMAVIRREGGEIVELMPDQRRAFASAVQPIYGEARSQYSRELLELLKL